VNQLRHIRPRGFGLHKHIISGSSTQGLGSSSGVVIRIEMKTNSLKGLGFAATILMSLFIVAALTVPVVRVLKDSVS
jgi:hypothetical protein